MQTGTIICHEHGYTLDDPILIDAIIEASQNSPCAVEPIADRAAFDNLPRDEQIALQLSFVQPLPVH
jgi:hypothetical protein